MNQGLGWTLSPEVKVNGIAREIVFYPHEYIDGLNKIHLNSLLKRIVKAEDIVKAVKYLLKSDFVT